MNLLFYDGGGAKGNGGMVLKKGNRSEVMGDNRQVRDDGV